MKKRILSLVLCAAMLLSMCLFLGAGVAEDTTAEGSAESTESYIPAVNFTNVAPFVQANAQAANGPARAPMFAANANGGSTTPTDPVRTTSDAVVTEKTATDLGNGQYQIKLTSYTTGTVTEQQTTKPTDIVLVLDQSGSMKDCLVCGGEIKNGSTHDAYVATYTVNQYGSYYIKDPTTGEYKGPLNWCDGEHKRKTCAGGAGWYPERSKDGTLHTAAAKLTPKTGPNSTGVQFYVKEQESCASRLSALKKAVTTFVDQVSKEATENKVEHRIAIVGFSSNDYDDGGTDFKNTEILTGCTVNNSNGVQYVLQPSSGTSTAYENYISACGKALVTPEKAKAAINYLEAKGGTETDKGMQMAKDILDNDSKQNDDRNRVVVLFTDGVPMIYSGYYGDSDSTITSRANRAINIANSICDEATVYTVGVFSGANGDISKGLPQNNGSWENGTNRPNRFMHLVSSNYPDAKAMDKQGNVNSSLKNGDSYYLSAGDAATLNSIFKKISDNISTPSIDLGTRAYVQDKVSDYFTAPADGKEVTVATQKAGYDESGKLVWTDETAPAGLKPEVNGKTVKVSGFDYDSNFVSASGKGRDENDQKKPGDFYGRRLVVTFTVKAEPGFLGGNNVPTNTSDSGVYDENKTLVENFDYPRVNVPITTPTLDSKDANVYYGGDVPKAEALCTTGTIGKKMDDYVDITYSVKGTVSNTTDDTYNVTMTVSPKYSGENANGDVQKAQTKTVTSTVNVYKPEVTFKDFIIDYNATPDYEKDNLVKVVWKRDGTDAVPENMTGTEPTLAYTYDPAASALTQDTGVRVTARIGERDIPADAVTFRHDPCTFPGCKYTDDCGYQFYVHINVFDLTIKKTAANGSEIDQNQTFVFHVKGNNNGVDMQVVITGPGKQVIKNLPVGEYTITEDTSWSWKYKPVGDAEKKLLTSNIENGAATVTFENKNNGTNWLTSLAKALNVWKNNGTTVERDSKN